jgi:hypothetical protein
MKKLFKLTDKDIAAIKSYLRALLAAGITMGITLLTDVRPEYALIIGALAAPLAKWADKNEKQFGVGSE